MNDQEESQETIQEKLSKKFHKKLIKRRKMPGGKQADYVEGSSVIRRLNECFGTEWSFEVKEHKMVESQIIVLGRLLYPKEDGSLGWKEQWGGSEVMRFRESKQIVNLGNDIKAATTDALKKCATLAGIALHLYEQDEYNGSTEDKTATKKIQMTDSEKKDVSEQVGKCSGVQANAIVKVLKSAEKTPEELEKSIGKKIEDLSSEEAGLIITKKHKFWS